MKERIGFLRWEVALYLLLLVVAGALRLSALDWPPLTDSEAVHALDAMEGTQGASAFWSPTATRHASNPLYHALTRFIFDLVGHSNAAARFIPALFGLGLVLAPLAFRSRLGAAGSLAAGWLIALSPSQVAVARTAGGPGMAALGFTIGIGLLVCGGNAGQRLFGLSGIGLGLACGMGSWTALLGVGLALAIGMAPYAFMHEGMRPLEKRWLEIGRFLWLPALVALALAAGFGLLPHGGGIFFRSIADWAAGWASAARVPALTLLAGIPIYEPLLLALGVAGAVMSFRERQNPGQALLWWALGSLLAVLLFSGRSMEDLTWVIVPLALLGARAVHGLVDRLLAVKAWEIVLGLGVVLVVLMGFAYMQLVSYGLGGGQLAAGTDRRLLLALAGAAVLLGGLVIWLFGLGWSWRLAWDGAAASGFLVLLALSISAGWRLSFGPTAATAKEIWRPQAATVGVDMVADILQAASQAVSGERTGMELQAMGEMPPSLAWAVRDFRAAEQEQLLEGQGPPAVLLPEAEADAHLASDYLGDLIVVRQEWGWGGVLPPELLSWWISRKAPVISERWLVLVRNDIAQLDILLPE